MIVTSLSALAASIRSTLDWERSNSDARKPAAPRKRSGQPDTADRSKDRAELSASAIELHKIASVQFHHLPASSRKESLQKRSASSSSVLAAHVVRRYTSGA